MRKIILDTSFLVNCVRFRIDFIQEINRICDFRYELFIIDKSIEELNSIIGRGGKSSSFAKLVLKMLAGFNIKSIVMNNDGIVDDLIISSADKDTVVATQDMPLRKKLKAISVPVIFIRQKKYLSF